MVQRENSKGTASPFSCLCQVFSTLSNKDCDFRVHFPSYKPLVYWSHTWPLRITYVLPSRPLLRLMLSFVSQEDEGPVPSPKQPSPSIANKLSDKAPINPMEGTTTGRPVKLAKVDIFNEQWYCFHRHFHFVCFFSILHLWSFLFHNSFLGDWRSLQRFNRFWILWILRYLRKKIRGPWWSFWNNESCIYHCEISFDFEFSSSFSGENRDPRRSFCNNWSLITFISVMALHHLSLNMVVFH